MASLRVGSGVCKPCPWYHLPAVVADYFILKQRVLDVDSLYRADPSGAYHYTAGFNLAALVALVAGVLPSVPGFLVRHTPTVATSRRARV